MIFGSFRVAAICASLVPALWCGHANAAGALAVGVAAGGAQVSFSYGVNSNSATDAEARNKALTACRESKEADERAHSRCRLIGTFTNQCGVVAMDPKAGTPGVGWAISATSAAAKAQALAACEATAGPQRAGACVVSGFRCDGKAQ